MPHVHRVVVLVGVAEYLALETLDDLPNRPTNRWKIFSEAALELLGAKWRGNLTAAVACRLEIASGYGSELLSDIERSICFELGENVIDHAPNLLSDWRQSGRATLRASRSVVR